MFFLAANEPAGGAALGEIAIATGAATVLTVAMVVLGMGHRSGRVPLLGRWAAFAGRRSGLPDWVALPSAMATVSLLLAVFGMYWDISLHIGVGRDDGPLANPAHYFILAGLFGIFTAGFVAMVLPHGRPSAAALRLGPGWHAPLGGVLICACGAFALLGFPLDDFWHRIFGQDVTLWGPTHLMLIGGASMTLVGIAVLIVEGRGSTHGLRTASLSGGLLIALSTFQAEFDFGVPQFRFVFQPLLIMVAAGVGLVAVRLYGGRGAALGAVAFFLLVRSLIALHVEAHFPLYLVEALVVEAAALRFARRPLAFALWSGAGIGTLGLAAEWAWTHVWMPLPWPAALLPEAALFGLPAAVAAALIGAWIGTHLQLRPALRTGAVAGAAVIAVLVGLALHKPADAGVRGTVTLDGGHATVTIDPAPRDPEWVTATAWQGGGLVVDHLRRTGPGRYETTRPLPLDGEWKTLIRLHEGDSLTGLPVYLPRDEAIPAPAVPAGPRIDREFVADHRILQREQQPAPAALSALAYGTVAAIALALLALLAWGLHRLASPGGRPTPPQRPAPLKAPRAMAPIGHTGQK